MCGILGVIGNRAHEEVRELSKRMSHRGPDESGFYCAPNGSMLTHERLAIIDLTTGRQPIKGTDNAYVVHNGEIYNHEDLRKNELSHHKFHTTCDSEVIVHLYEEYGNDFCNKLDGVFVFMVMDNDKFIVGRDPIGVKPLYYGSDEEGRMYFASEMKAIVDQCADMKPFPPGHYYTPETGFVKYYEPEWFDHKKAIRPMDLTLLRESFTEAVKKRLMSDVPLGVLLSGGLDSSLVSAITKRLQEEEGNGAILHSFSVGISTEAPDMKAARKVAEFIGTKHHDVVFSIEEGIEAIEKVIWHTETYDITTIRASTPMYFLSKFITDMGVKVVLSGEGSDEVFGGYLYFYNAPSAEDFQKETIERVQRLSTADVLRADKSTMAHGLEARVPFLDRQFLNDAILFCPEDKMPDREAGRIEKYPLRAAFDDPDNPYLPEEILWRQKEQFSDGVGYSWIDSLVAYANSQVNDDDFAKASERFPYNTPETKEAYYYRCIFEKFYPQESAMKTVKKWVPKWQKSTDPSGRVCDIHIEKVDVD